MLAGFDQFGWLSTFNDATGLKHQDAIGNEAQHIEIAAGAQHGEAVVRTDAVEQDEELRLLDWI